MKKKTAFVLICILFLSALSLQLVSANKDEIPTVLIGEYAITPQQVEAVNNLTVYFKDHMGMTKYTNKADTLNALVTQRVLYQLFDEYDIQLSAQDEVYWDNSFADFEESYEQAIAMQKDSEIAYHKKLQEPFDEMRKASGMTQSEFEQYCIDGAKYILKRKILVDEKFGGDNKALKRAVENAVASGKVKVTTQDGKPYRFKAIVETNKKPRRTKNENAREEGVTFSLKSTLQKSE